MSDTILFPLRCKVITRSFEIVRRLSRKDKSKIIKDLSFSTIDCFIDSRIDVIEYHGHETASIIVSDVRDGVKKPIVQTTLVVTGEFVFDRKKLNRLKLADTMLYNELKEYLEKFDKEDEEHYILPCAIMCPFLNASMNFTNV